METPISEILDETQQQPDHRQLVQTDGTAGFAVGPDNVQSHQNPVPVPLPTGPSQGQSSAGTAGLAKEFFNVQSDDLLSIILVFGILLLVSSGTLNGLLSSVPMFITNDKLTPVGAIVVSAVFAILYFLIKILGRKFF